MQDTFEVILCTLMKREVYLALDNEDYTRSRPDGVPSVWTPTTLLHEFQQGPMGQTALATQATLHLENRKRRGIAGTIKLCDRRTEWFVLMPIPDKAEACLIQHASSYGTTNNILKRLQQVRLVAKEREKDRQERINS